MVNIGVHIILFCFATSLLFLYGKVRNRNEISYSLYYLLGIVIVCLLSVIFYSVVGLDNLSNYFYAKVNINKFYNLIFFNCLLITNCFLVGMLIVQSGYSVSPKKPSLNTKEMDWTALSKRKCRLILFLCMLWIVTNILFYQAELISRSSYVVDNVSAIERTLLFLPILPLVFFLGTVTSKYSILKMALYFSIILIILAIGSRRIVLVPILYFVGSYISQQRKAHSIVYTSFQVLILFAVTLIMRNLPDQGLINIVIYLQDVANFVSTSVAVDNIFIYLVNNFTFGTLLSVFLISQETVLSHNFLMQSINILPSSLVISPDFYEETHASATVPKNSLFILVSSESAYFIAVYFGMLLEVSSLLINYAEKRSGIIKLILVSFLLLSFLFFTQYGLRQTIRPLYYLIFLGLTIKFVRSVRLCNK